MVTISVLQTAADFCNKQRAQTRPMKGDDFYEKHF